MRRSADLCRYVACVLVMSCAATAPASRAPEAAAPTADEVLNAMVTTYAKASSYEDRGTVTTVFSRGGAASSTRQLSFETAFDRGRRFRFEYRLDQQFRGRPLYNPRSVIWSDFAHTYSEWPLAPRIIDDRADLAMAVHAAAGTSSLSSVTIPGLLMPNLGGVGVLHPSAASVDGVEVVSGHQCWRLRGMFRTDDPVTLWIDRDSHLLRKVATSHHFPDFETATTTAYEPDVNRPVAAGHLEPPDIGANPPVPRPAQPTQPPWIGLMFESRTTTKIETVLPGTPAERAGLQIGDEIVSVDGSQVARGADVVAIVTGHKAGDRLVLSVSRGGNTLEIPVTLEARKDAGALARASLLDRPAPPFDLPVVVGIGPAKLADLKGSVLIVDFWATWCGPCLMMVPSLNALAQKYPQLHIVGISNDAPSDIQRYATDHHVAYTLASDADSKVLATYDLGGAIPMIVVIDKTGVVRRVELGAGDTSAVDELVAKLLQ